jgi:hypothetical protein
MSTSPSDAHGWATRTIHASIALAAWTVAWVASLALATFAPGALWNDMPALTVGAIVVSVLIGVGMLLAHKRQLQTMDEFQRATQLQAMAWSLGAGLVGGTALTLLDRHDVIGIDVGIGHLIVLMAVVYMIGTVAGTLRYR